MTRIPLDLYGEVTAPDGTRYKWDANQSADSRPQNLTFGTKIGEGFSGGGLQLSRRIDLDYPDIGLVYDVTFRGADGSTAYEGRIAANPRDLQDQHSMGVTLAGWIAHAKDRRFQEIYCDRRLDAWGEMLVTRKAALASSGISTGDFSWTTQDRQMVCALPNQALGGQTLGESDYHAPDGVTVAKIQYVGSSTSAPAYQLQFVELDSAGLAQTTGTTPTNDGSVHTITCATPTQHVGVKLYSNGTAVTPTAGALIQYSALSAIGNHGLTLYAGESGQPDGVLASDAIRNIAARWCPRLSTAGVQDTSYPIQHLAFTDRTFPFDAWLEINKYHLWFLGVWENKTLYFQPYDLTDYDWEIRTDDPGTTFSPQGPSTDDVFNGIAVTYTDLPSGLTKIATPDTTSDLADTDVANPWNQANVDHWDEITLSTPTLTAVAEQIGRTALEDRNRPKTPGTITVRGYIRDRAGNQQPVWKIRAGDTISITNFPNDSPRLIVETSYDDESKTAQLSIDQPFALIDAYLDRLGNALGARGI
jgi:hypothetical protein